MDNRQSKHLYVIGNGEAKHFTPTEFKILDDEYLQLKDFEPVPIEDFDYIFIAEEVDCDTAYDRYLELI